MGHPGYWMVVSFAKEALDVGFSKPGLTQHNGEADCRGGDDPTHGTESPEVDSP